jgi:hypothetical protein
VLWHLQRQKVGVEAPNWWGGQEVLPTPQPSGAIFMAGAPGFMPLVASL